MLVGIASPAFLHLWLPRGLHNTADLSNFNLPNTLFALTLLCAAGLGVKAFMFSAVVCMCSSGAAW